MISFSNSFMKNEISECCESHSSDYLVSDLLDLVNSDVYDMTENSVGGNRYSLTLSMTNPDMCEQYS